MGRGRTIQRMRRVGTLPSALVLLMAVLLSGCAAQKEGASGESDDGTAEVEAGSLEGTPVEPQTPAPECESDAQCTLSVHLRPVDSVEDCYCTGCPAPLATAAAAANQHGWNLHCGDWAARRACPVPMCAPPTGDVACLDGACGWRMDEGAGPARPGS